MQIKSIKYSEYERDPRQWSLDTLTLGPINLVVGRNAVGKTRLLNLMNALAKIVSGRSKPMTTGTYTAEFVSETSTFKYSISFRNNKVLNEHLREKPKGGRFRDLLRRGENGYGRIRMQRGRLDELIDFECPVEQIGVYSRRDKVNHPFLEEFVEWGLSAYHFNFGVGEIREFVIKDSGIQAEYDPLDTSKFTSSFDRGYSEFGDDYKHTLLNDLAYSNSKGMLASTTLSNFSHYD